MELKNYQAMAKALERAYTFSRTRAGGLVNTQDLFKLTPEELKEMIDAEARIYNDSKRSTDDALESLGLSNLFNATPKSKKSTNVESEIKIMTLSLVFLIKEEKKIKAEKAKDIRDKRRKLDEAALRQEEASLLSASGSSLQATREQLDQQLAELEGDW